MVSQEFRFWWIWCFGVFWCIVSYCIMSPILHIHQFYTSTNFTHCTILHVTIPALVRKSVFCSCSQTTLELPLQHKALSDVLGCSTLFTVEKFLLLKLGPHFMVLRILFIFHPGIYSLCFHFFLNCLSLYFAKFVHLLALYINGQGPQRLIIII